jgi:hypothetical protein
MNNYEQLQEKAEYLSQSLQNELAALVLKFDKTVRVTGEKYGLNLLTEVTVGIDSKRSGE